MFCLALHAGYQCRHAGACCGADWIIPAETHVLQVVGAGGIIGPDTASAFVAVEDDADPVVARRADGSCVFFNRDGTRLCAIHQAAGVEALPSACRHFPREILQDPRGTFISLSHFCPTAARTLLAADPSRMLQVIEAPPPLRLTGAVEGLDARDALPPLVRPGLLGDFAGYDAWERSCLATLARPGLTSRRALYLISTATDDIREWTPGGERLADRVVAAFSRAVAAGGVDDRTPDRDRDFEQLAARYFPPSAAPVPAREEVWRTLIAPSIDSLDHGIRNYLAARLFGNWIAYQGRGWRTIVSWLGTTLAVVENELTRRAAASGKPATEDDFIAAVGAADLLLLHTIDSDVLARHFAPAEGPEPR